jgi:hypothetical protein
MTLGRFTGGWFIDRYSRVAVVRASAVMGALGIGLIIFVDNPGWRRLGTAVGLGASLGFPLTISAASDTGPDAPKRVSVVAITGYLAFLVGPPLLGFLGEHFGLRSAMMVVLGLVMVAALVAARWLSHNLNPLWRTDNEHQTDCGRHGWHLLSDAKTYNRRASSPSTSDARTEYSLRGRQRQPVLPADLLFPEIAHEIAFVAENGGWVVSANEDVFNCQLPKDHFNAVVDHLQTLPNIEIIACGKRSAYTLNRYNDALKTVAAKYYHRLELVDDFNHLDDTILKFGLNVPDSLIPQFSRSCTRRWGYGHRGGHRLRQHRLDYPGRA